MTGRRQLVAVLAGVLIVMGLVVLPGAFATQSVSTSRLAGADRYTTAAAIATTTYSKVGEAVVASGEDFPDALSASALAGVLAGPILLTPRATLAKATSDALKQLGVTKVTIVGGTNAVSSAVETQLKASYSVTRLSGPDRYQTAQVVAVSYARDSGTIGGQKAAFVASGENYPDALAGGSPAFAKKLPMILTESSQLSYAANETLNMLQIKRVILLGGPAAVKPEVEDAIRAKGITVERVGGANRADTAAKLAEYSLVTLGFSNTQVGLASGRSFADALAAAPHAGKALVPVLLMGSVPPETAGYVRNHNSTIGAISVYGGTAVISDQDVQELKATATCTPAPTTTTSPIPLPTTTTTSSTTTSSTTSSTLPGATTTVGPTTSTTIATCSTPTTASTTTSTSMGATTTSTTPASTSTTQCVPGTQVCGP